MLKVSLLADFLPTEGQGHVLLTTRALATGKILGSLPAEKMEVSGGIKQSVPKEF
jgi:hypothetical protein